LEGKKKEWVFHFPDESDKKEWLNDIVKYSGDDPYVDTESTYFSGPHPLSMLIYQAILIYKY